MALTCIGVTTTMHTKHIPMPLAPIGWGLGARLTYVHFTPLQEWVQLVDWTAYTSCTRTCMVLVLSLQLGHVTPMCICGGGGAIGERRGEGGPCAPLQALCFVATR